MHKPILLLMAAGVFVTTLGVIPAFAALQPSFRGYTEGALPVPDPSNNCGRTALTQLKPDLASQENWPYPVDAQRLDQQGRVLMRVVVGADGAPTDAVVVKSSKSALLDDAAVSAVKTKWRWTKPAPACWKDGAVIPVAYDWLPDGAEHVRIYLDDPLYPAGARVQKQGGTGSVTVRLRVHNVGAGAYSEDTQIAHRTGSTEMDAAMLAFVRSRWYVAIAGDYFMRPFHLVIFEFVPEANPETIDMLMGPAATPPPPVLAPVALTMGSPAPSIANDCGRGAPAYLTPIMSTRVAVDIPLTPSITVMQRAGRGLSLQVVEQGAMRMRVVVDKEGKVGNLQITDSSAPPEMEKAVTAVVRNKYRWEPPPPECQEQGVQQDVNYVFSWAPAALQIYADDPRYPAEAHERKMGAPGVLQLSYDKNGFDDTKIVVSTGSTSLDRAMTRIVQDAFLDSVRRGGEMVPATKIFGLMFMPDYLKPERQ